MSTDHSHRTIRKFQPADEAAVVAVWHRAGIAAYPFLPTWQAFTLEQARCVFDRIIRPHCAIWVATLDERVVAYLAMKGTYMDRLYVDPLEWRKGWGTQLVNSSLGEAVGKEYVERHFPPGAKAQIEEMVDRLKAALQVNHASTKLVAYDDGGTNWRIGDDVVNYPDFGAVIDVLGQHSPGVWRSLYQTYTVTANALSTGKPLWASEQSAESHDVGGPSWARGIIRAYEQAVEERT